MASPEMKIAFEVTPARLPEDYAAVESLWHGYRDYLESIDCYNFGGETIDPELAALAKLYPEKDGGVFLLYENDSLMGTVALNRIDSERGEIRRLFVWPHAQGRGYGRKLMLHVLQEAQRIGYSSVLLDTFRSQQGPQSLYRSLGFEECAPYSKYPPEFILFMERKIK